MTASVRSAVGIRPGRLVLFALVPGLLLVDMVNGLVGGSVALGGIPSPAEVVRGGILLAGLLAMLRAIHPDLRRLQVWILLLAVLGSVALLYRVLAGGSMHELRVNLSQLLKTLYGPGLVLLLVVVIRRHALQASDVLEPVAWVAGLAGGSIVLLTLTGIGQTTYLQHGVGSKGLFIAQNDIGVAMGIGLIGCADMVFRSGRTRYAVLGTLGIAGMLMLGTRAAMAAAFAMPLAMLVVYRSRIFGSRRRVFLGLLLSSALAIVLAVAAIWQYRTIQEESFQQQKLEALADNPFVRGIRVLAAFDHVRQRPALANIIGEGFVSYSRGVARNLGQNLEGVLAEVDWIDMYGVYGILFALAIYLFYFDSLRVVRRLRRPYGSPTVHTAALAVAWFLLHSAVAGHALAGTIPAGTLAPVIALAWAEGNQLRHGEVTDE